MHRVLFTLAQSRRKHKIFFFEPGLTRGASLHDPRRQRLLAHDENCLREERSPLASVNAASITALELERNADWVCCAVVAHIVASRTMTRG